MPPRQETQVMMKMKMIYVYSQIYFLWIFKNVGVNRTFDYLSQINDNDVTYIEQQILL